MEANSREVDFFCGTQDTMQDNTQDVGCSSSLQYNNIERDIESNIAITRSTPPLRFRLQS